MISRCTLATYYSTPHIGDQPEDPSERFWGENLEIARQSRSHQGSGVVLSRDAVDRFHLTQFETIDNVFWRMIFIFSPLLCLISFEPCPGNSEICTIIPAGHWSYQSSRHTGFWVASRLIEEQFRVIKAGI